MVTSYPLWTSVLFWGVISIWQAAHTAGVQPDRFVYACDTVTTVQVASVVTTPEASSCPSFSFWCPSLDEASVFVTEYSKHRGNPVPADAAPCDILKVKRPQFSGLEPDTISISRVLKVSRLVLVISVFLHVPACTFMIYFLCKRVPVEKWRGPSSPLSPVPSRWPWLSCSLYTWTLGSQVLCGFLIPPEVSFFTPKQVKH